MKKMATDIVYMKCVFISIFVFFGCSHYPKDPEDTLIKVQNNHLIVGFSENPPWIMEDANDIRGIEADLIEEYASYLNAEIKWIKNTENELFKDLIDKKLHIVVAGFTSDTPWKKEKIGITRPYFKNAKMKHVMAVQEGENAFLVSLEKFLFLKKNEMQELVERYETDR